MFMMKYYKMKEPPLVIENISLLPDIEDEYSIGLIKKIDNAIGASHCRIPIKSLTGETVVLSII